MLRYLHVALCVMMMLPFKSMAQNADSAFVKIESLYLPDDNKGRLELQIIRYKFNVDYRSTIRDFTAVESFMTYTDELNVVGIEHIVEPRPLLIHIDYQLTATQVDQIIREVNQSLKKMPSRQSGVMFRPVLVGDSLGYYKVSCDTNQLEIGTDANAWKKTPYSLNLSELHKQIGGYLPNSCFVSFVNQAAISNTDATIHRIIGVAVKEAKSPWVVVYVIDESPVPEHLLKYLNNGHSPPNMAIEDQNLKNFSKNFNQIISTGFAMRSKLTLDTKKPTYKGESRTLTLNWLKSGVSDSYTYTFGSTDYPLNIKELNKDLIFWVSCIFFGLIILLAIFFLLSVYYPYSEEKKFFKRYVGPYVPVPNVVKYDTMTNEPIEKGTLVVTRCSEVVPYSVWKGLGNQCPNYPDCMDYLGCSGSGKMEIHYKFFSQSGAMKKFNWLFYGACGGFIAWLISLLVITLFGWVRPGRMFIGFHNSDNLLNLPEFYFLENVHNQMAVGFGIGIGLGGALILADYFSSIIKPRIIVPITKIIVTGLVTSFFFGFIYGLSFYLNINNFISGFLSWAIFSVILALGLSVYSPSINFKRALIATSIGVSISFLLYHLSSELTSIGYRDFSPSRQLLLELTKVLRLVVLGGLTGYIATNVLKRLEDYELELLSPDHVSGRTVPISKILKTGSPVTIGSAPKNILFIKWSDPGAEETHARLDLTNDGVVLTPSAEIIVNKEYLNKGLKHQLKDNDTIQLGRHSCTLLRFRVKYL